MKQLLRLIATVGLASAASCGHSAVTTVPAIPASFAAANPDSFPPTVHVIPFYNYGKSGYEPVGIGNSGGLIGGELAHQYPWLGIHYSVGHRRPLAE